MFCVRAYYFRSSYTVKSRVNEVEVILYIYIYIYILCPLVRKRTIPTDPQLFVGEF
jgi:hypothetical protein